jgi:tetraacyldisaccharide 4'-kinase
MLERGWRAWALFDVSLCYRGLMALRHKLYARGWFKQHKLPVPVIVVGSLLVGGTGKTPLTIWLTQQLRSRGIVPGVISRGYGADPHAAKQVRAITPHSSPQAGGDEPLLIAQQTGVPVFVGRDRVAAARALLAAHPQVNVIIADDGLQHLALARDIEIAVFDARGFGNGFTLPAGPLRESITRLESVHVLVSRDAPALPELTRALAMRLEINALENAASHETLSPQAFAARHPHILAAAGIGHPQNFFDALAAAGIAAQTLPLPDHYDFAQTPFPPQADLAIVITQKDVLKTAHLNDTRLWVAHAVTTVDARLLAQIEGILHGPQTT